MDAFLLHVFRIQVASQCNFLLFAAEEANKALQQHDVKRVFYAMQNLLNAAANISKILWGSGGKYADARKPLRDIIGINDGSPLREVTMRNNFEHIDERIDRWWKESKGHNLTDMNIGPVSTPNEIDNFRNFNPTTKNMTFWGQEFNLQKLVDEAGTILSKLEATNL
jgi:hypothetical protein